VRSSHRRRHRTGAIPSRTPRGSLGRRTTSRKRALSSGAEQLELCVGCHAKARLGPECERGVHPSGSKHLPICAVYLARLRENGFEAATGCRRIAIRCVGEIQRRADPASVLLASRQGSGNATMATLSAARAHAKQ
jgi:hypothetical protein